MTFRRTKHGLESEHLFHDVDWIVYCEGRRIDSESATFDELFWTKMLEDNGLRCRCKSLGSKAAVVEVARQVLDNDVRNVIVALDRDYDHLTGRLIVHPRVLYTYGYSWESDVCLHFDIASVVLLFFNAVDSGALADEFDRFRRDSAASMRRVFALDFKYHNHDHRLFDRNKPNSIIDRSSQSPKISVGRLLESSRSLAKHNPFSLSKDAYNGACGFRDFHGKTVARLVYRWFDMRSRKVTDRRAVSYNAFMAVAIGTGRFTGSSTARNSYYSKILASV